MHMNSNKSRVHRNERETNVMKIIADKGYYGDQNLVIGGEDVEPVSSFATQK